MGPAERGVRTTEVRPNPSEPGREVGDGSGPMESGRDELALVEWRARATGVVSDLGEPGRGRSFTVGPDAHETSSLAVGERDAEQTPRPASAPHGGDQGMSVHPCLLATETCSSTTLEESRALAFPVGESAILGDFDCSGLDIPSSLSIASFGSLRKRYDISSSIRGKDTPLFTRRASAGA